MNKTLASERVRLVMIALLAMAWTLLCLWHFKYESGVSRAIDVFMMVGSFGMIVLCGMSVTELVKNIVSSDIEKFLEKSEELYFHGLSVRQYIENDAFEHLGQWAKDNFSYEAAVIAMLILKDNTSAVLHHGICKYNWTSRTHITDRHAWVEFRVGLRLYVADLTTEKGVYSRNAYFREGGPGEDLATKWQCGYGTFWALKFASVLYDAMLSRETSYVMRELSGFGSFAAPISGFLNWVYRAEKMAYSDGTYMEPYERTRAVISTEIIRDFGKKKKRQQPKSKSVRWARKNMPKKEPPVRRSRIFLE